ncbi:hypothetical protein [Carboxylicivirga marina]|uniref:Uncharacterized protein n=1 Tax=Carboxylicivirga marina TaxID=2800988 RepID=A0ABS1HEP9_9BACT|nr:hypothetical protein [Carboxylicivirga marina]MBK3515940.1 hypothetical protein [Carboxylicivirga marina]
MKESTKRDFVTQMIELLQDEKETLVLKGYKADVKITELGESKKACDLAELQQQKAHAAAKDATKVANDTLDVAYRAASDTADLLSGLLGKDNEIVKKMRKFRN